MKSYKKLLLISCILCIIQLLFLPVKAEKLTGTAEEIQWEYDNETKTLTFWGKGKIPDGKQFDCCENKEYMLWEYKKEEIQHIVLNEGITEIGETAFCFMMNLKTVKLCNSLEIIGERAFSYDGNLESVELSENLKEIRNGAFEECTQLSNVRLSSNLKEIPYRMFDGCTSLTTIKLPKSVTTIGEGAFARTGIKQITLPKNVTYIGKNKVDKNNHYGVFEECTSLKEIVVRSRKVKKVTKYTWNGLQKNAVIRVPKSKKKEYQKLFRKAKLSKKQKVRMKK